MGSGYGPCAPSPYLHPANRSDDRVHARGRMRFWRLASVRGGGSLGLRTTAQQARCSFEVLAPVAPRGRETATNPHARSSLRLRLAFCSASMGLGILRPGSEIIGSTGAPPVGRGQRGVRSTEVMP